MSQVVEKGSRHGLQGEQNFIEKILVALDGSESADKERARNSTEKAIFNLSRDGKDKGRPLKTSRRT